MYTPSDTRLEWLGEGLCLYIYIYIYIYSSCTRINAEGLKCSQYHFLGYYLSQAWGPLARYGNHQETISRRPEQMYTSSDTRLEWPGEGPLFESDSNKCQVAKMEPLFESPPGPLFDPKLE